VQERIEKPQPPSLLISHAEALRLRPKELDLFRASLADVRHEFGVGIAAYFLLVRSLLLCVLVTSCTAYVVNTALMAAASADPRLPPLAGPQRLAAPSLASMQTLIDPATGAPVLTYSLDGAFPGLDKRKALLLASALDSASVLALLAVVAWFHGAARRLDTGADKATLADYSALIRGLPRVALGEAELMAHLEKQEALRGRMVSAHVALSYGEVWDLLDEKARVEERLASLRGRAAATGELLHARIAACNLRLQYLNMDLHVYDTSRLVCCAAFVTFATEADRDAACALFHDDSPLSPRAWLHPPERLFRGTHRLRMSPAGEAADVLHENLHVHAWWRCARQAAIGLAIVALLLCTAAFAVAARGFENRAPPFVACAAINATLPCDALWNLTASRSDADCGRQQVSALAASDPSPGACAAYISAAGGGWLPKPADWLRPPPAAPAPACPLVFAASADAAALSRCAAGICQTCYCTGQGLSSWSDGAPQLGSFCDDFWRAFGYGWLLRAFSFLVIILVNIGLRLVLPPLTRWERLHSSSSAALSLAVKTLLALFCNSFVVSLLVDSQIVTFASDGLPLHFSGPFSDFTPRWYATAGAAMAITCISQSLQPALMHSLTTAVMRARLAGRVRRAYTQEALNALHAGPEWELGTRLSGTLSCLWLSWALCGGMPYLAFLQPPALGLSLLLDRWYLFRVARKPAPFGVDAVLSLTRLLLWGAWMHFGITFWQFGAPSLPAYETAAASPNPQQSEFDAGPRLGRAQSLLQAIPFFALSLWLILLQPLGGAQLWGGGRRGRARRSMRTAGPAPAPWEAQRPDSFVSAVAACGGWDGPTSYEAAKLQRYQARLAQLEGLHHSAPLARTSLVPLLQLTDGRGAKTAGRGLGGF